MALGNAAGEPETDPDRMADELTIWVRDNCPSWRDNDPYYNFWYKARDMFKAALERNGAALVEARNSLAATDQTNTAAYQILQAALDG